MCTTERENTQNETEDSTMNEKVARQIEEMKKQTIGVEVEMNNNSRRTSALQDRIAKNAKWLLRF